MFGVKDEGLQVVHSTIYIELNLSELTVTNLQVLVSYDLDAVIINHKCDILCAERISPIYYTS